MKQGRQTGAALIETVLLGLILLAPLMWLLTTLSQVQRGAFAAAAAAREAGFEAVRANSVAAADRGVRLAVQQAFEDHGLTATRARVRWTSTGFERGGRVEVEVSYPVPVLRAPAVGVITRPAIWVRARHLARIDPFRSGA